MEKKIKIAFDLDGVIIDKPPFVPKKLLEWLFKGGDGGKLFYRFPQSKLEQKIRKFSHFYLFRPPIGINIEFIKKLAAKGEYELYIVSGRYSFLAKETESWLKKKGINKLFKKVFLNLDDEQPHLFKEKKLREIEPDIFIDDDDLIADYLAEKLPKTRILCRYDRGEHCRKTKFINSLSEILTGLE